MGSQNCVTEFQAQTSMPRQRDWSYSAQLWNDLGWHVMFQKHETSREHPTMSFAAVYALQCVVQLASTAQGLEMTIVVSPVVRPRFKAMFAHDEDAAVFDGKRRMRRLLYWMALPHDAEHCV